MSNSNKFDRDGYCNSCGYRRPRPPDAACDWPDKHTFPASRTAEPEPEPEPVPELVPEPEPETGHGIKVGTAYQRVFASSNRPGRVRWVRLINDRVWTVSGPPGSVHWSGNREPITLNEFRKRFVEVAGGS